MNYDLVDLKDGLGMEGVVEGCPPLDRSCDLACPTERIWNQCLCDTCSLAQCQGEGQCNAMDSQIYAVGFV